MARLDPIELAAWCGGEWTRGVSGAVSGVSNDSRRIEKGDLYVALRGERFDGHRFVDDAFCAGAAGAVVREDWRPAGGAAGPLLKVEDPARALQEMAAAYRRKLAVGIVGITGSAGKTTVKELTASMLAASMTTARTQGNWNNDIGLPLSLLAMEQDTEVGVFEVGTNHPGEMEALCRILEPSWGMVTNIGAGHIGFFGSLEAVAREKAALLESLPTGGTAVLNDDSACFGILREAAPCRVLTVSLKAGSGADYSCVERNVGLRRARIRETGSGEELEITDLQPGAHSVLNVLLAAAVARGHGVEWAGIAEAVRCVGSLSMRWERMEIGGITVINDAYNSNPLSARAALEAYGEEVIAGDKWIALGDMFELGGHEEAEHRSLGAHVAAGSWRGIVTVGRGGDWIADGAEEGGFAGEHPRRCRDNREAAEFLAARLRPGDAVLLKASRGMRLEGIIDHLKELR
jgi:UDP-N-acetylmuramoyl-tripeptide--D-alanyl-D-alanine ligase